MSNEVQLACFKVGEEMYAADIMLIREIILCRKVTRIPNAPDFIEGIINQRGKAIPVIDMRKRLGLEHKERSRDTRIIVMKFQDCKRVGIIVDSVVKVLKREEGDIQAVPRIAKGIESEYLSGIVRDGEEMVLILDMERVLTTTEKVRLGEFSEQ
ncbi:MAG: purine-binding chemotaxis protein CheW [Deltaproteobacteria bacterium]|nr:purine-binding chemotaxis protein CheW [Deltaproteobacteria bacterium]